MKRQVFRFTMIFQRQLEHARLSYLGLNRGEKLGILKVGFEHATDRILAFFAARFKVKNAYIDEVVQQSVKKKVLPAIERRIRTELTEKQKKELSNSFLTTCAISSWLLR